MYWLDGNRTAKKKKKNHIPYLNTLIRQDKIQDLAFLPLFCTYSQSNPGVQRSSLISEDSNDLISLRQLVNVQLDHLHAVHRVVRIK